MTLHRYALALVLIGALLAGCGKDDEKPTAPGTGGGEAEPNDFAAQSVGTLSTTDIVMTGTASSAADVDLFRVTLSSPANLFVSLDWNSAADLELAISNAAGIFVRKVDTAGHPESCRLAGLPAGAYTVRVGSLTATATAYSLTLGLR